VSEQGVIDPWVSDWIAANPERAAPFDDFSPELLELARGPFGYPTTRDIASVTGQVLISPGVAGGAVTGTS